MKKQWNMRSYTKVLKLILSGKTLNKWEIQTPQTVLVVYHSLWFALIILWNYPSFGKAQTMWLKWINIFRVMIILMLGSFLVIFIAHSNKHSMQRTVFLKYVFFHWFLNPFLANVPILYTLKTPENLIERT